MLLSLSSFSLASLSILLTSSTVFGASIPWSSPSNSSLSTWTVTNFKNLITFGDSYTDETRLNYFLRNNGSAPPAGVLLPEGFNTPGGGRTWSRYVVQYTGQAISDGGEGEMWEPEMTLYNYAVSGAVCSNEITPRYYAAINQNYPSVIDYEVPAFKADQTAKRNGTDLPFFQPSLTASNSVYSLWIGTNDLGHGSFLTDEQVLGKVLTDYTDCVYQVFDELYAAGGRVFVLMNTIPLQLTPLYANFTLNGTTAANSGYWPTKPANNTAIAEKMHEETTSVNNVFKYQTPFELLVAKRYPGSSWALFDTWSLFSDIYDSPAQYFNGSEPANVTSSEALYNSDGSVTTFSYNGTSADSFMWYDSLHPSEQTDRIIARNFIDVLNGKSQYATYY